MNVSVLCSAPRHPVVPRLREWMQAMKHEGHRSTLCFDKAELAGGDMLFLVSCSQLVGDAERGKFGAVLVLHAADLPRGRGWSPHVWSILEGARQIPVCLLEAADPVDSGPVWLRTEFTLEGHELLPEINRKVFDAELLLMSEAVRKRASIKPVPQSGEPGPYRRRRTPADSRLDPDRTLAEQFNLLRVVDNDRYPAFFDLHGQRYAIRIEKLDHDR